MTDHKDKSDYAITNGHSIEHVYYRVRQDEYYPAALDEVDRLALAKRRQTDDPHLNLLLFILHGMPPAYRERWMEHNMPKTLTLLSLSKLFQPTASPHKLAHPSQKAHEIVFSKANANP